MRRLGARMLIFLFFSTSWACGDSKEESKKETVQEQPTEKEATAPVAPVTDASSKKRKEGKEPLPVPATYFKNLKAKKSAPKIRLERRKGASVVLIVIDALNTKHVGAYGYDRETTPNIDALASKGMMATNYISNSSWTRPSFTTIITGLPKREHKVELKSPGIDDEIDTIAERFQAAGYKTAGIVGNPLVRDIWGYDQGYDLYADTTTFEKFFPPDARLARRAGEWLDRLKKDEPFFLKIFFTAPHTPYRPIPGHRGFTDSMPKGEIVEYPFREYLKPMDKDDHAKTVAAYDDEVRYADLQVGKILEKLEEIGRANDTIVLVTADHGEIFGDHNCYQHAYHMWEPALRVPMVIRVPWMDLGGTYEDRPYTHIDLVPTLLDLAGLQDEGGRLKGRSIIADLADPKANRERTIFSQYNAHDIRRQAIRKGRWKLVHHHPVDKEALTKLNSLHRSIPHADPENLPSLATDGERWELFDLQADPGENKNLFEGAAKSKELDELMKELAPSLGDETEDGTLSKELLEALTAAGYFVPSS